MRFSELMRSVRADGDGFVLDVPDDWLQGRTVFGGVQAALGLHAMRAQVPAAMPLRTLQGTFFAPVPGGPVRARARLLRTGKSTIYAEAQLLDGAQPLCTLLGVFGSARASTLSLLPRQAAAGAAAPVEFRYQPGVTPNFTQHFAARWLRGGLPFTGSTEAENVIELSLRGDGMAGEAQVLAFADFIPPVALSWLTRPSPGATMTWMIEFLRERCDDLPLSGWRVDARLEAALGGYTSQALTLWGPGGVPVAFSRQSMVIFG